MKNHRINHWLDVAEYLSLAGVGAGSVASAIAQQFLYATAPLSLAVIVGISNRRRLQALQQQTSQQRTGDLDRLSQEVTRLRRHLQTLPPPETITALEQSQQQQHQSVEEISGYVKSAYTMLGERLVSLEEQDYDLIRQDIQRLRAAHGSIHTLLDNLQVSLKEMTTREQIEVAERAIAQLQQQVQRVDLQIQKIDDIEPALAQLQAQYEQISQLPAREDSGAGPREAWQDEIVDLIADLVPRRDWNTISAQVQALQRQYEAQAERDQQLDQRISAIQHQRPESDQDLEAITSRWQSILETVQDRIQTLSSSDELASGLQPLVAEDSPHQLLIDWPAHRAQHPASQAESSRLALEEALRQAENRVIVTWPLSPACQLDDSLRQQLDAYLASGKSLSIGWSSPHHRHVVHFLGPIRQAWQPGDRLQQDRHGALQYFLQQKRRYPKQLLVKLLEAGENFLVVDQTQAIVGIQHPLTTSTNVPLDLKVRTANPAVIHSLIERYTHGDQALDSGEMAWRQAMAQYDLGECSAAIAELNRLLEAAPRDAAAYEMLGIIHYGQGDYKAALGDLSQAIRLDPAAGSAYCNRGFLQYQGRNIRGAIADLNQATRLMPDSAIPLFYRGRAWEVIKSYSRALADYQAASVLAPEAAILLYRRAMVHRHLRQIPQAKQDLNTAAWRFIRQNNTSAARRCLQVLKRWERSPNVSAANGASAPQRPEALVPQVNPKAASL
ncbi:MAG: tetratricopeptide repeat protein [Elainellaceae cyanobacterium]